MKILSALVLLLATATAQAEETSFPLFCNVTEYLGSSYQKGEGDWRSHYSKTQTRVFWEAEMVKGVELDAVLVQGMSFKLGLGTAITWDSNSKEVGISIVEGRIRDEQNETEVSAESNFTQATKDETPGLATFLRVSRKNDDVIEFSCAKRVK